MMGRRLGGLLAGTAIVVMAILAASPHGAAAASGGTLQVYTQTYATDLPRDPYGNDQLATHVGVTAGTETYRAFISFDVSRLPSAGPTPTVSLSVAPISATTSPTEAGANVNASSALPEACPLTQPIPAGYDPTVPTPPAPTYDCSTTDIKGVAQADGSFTFDLSPLAAIWRDGGQPDGVVIRPDSAPTSNYQLGLDDHQTKVTYTIPTPSSGTIAPPSFPQPSFAATFAPASSVATAPTVVVPVTPPTAPASSAPPAPSAAAAPSRQPAAIASVSPNSGGSLLWLWTLLAAVLASCVAGAIVLWRRWLPVVAPAATPGPARPGSSRVPFALAAQTPTALLMVGAVIAFGFIAPGLVSNAQGGGGGTAAVGPGTTTGGPAGGSTASGAPGASGGPAGSTSTGPGVTGSGPSASGGPGGVGQASAAAANNNFDVTIGDYNVNSSANTNEFGGTPIYAAAQAPAKKAVTDYINATGGLGGHKLVWVDDSFNDTGSDTSNFDQGCTDLTQSDHVFVAFNLYDANDFSNLACYARAQTPVLSFSQYVPDQSTLRTFAPWVHELFVPSADRVAALQVDGLQQAGFYSDANSQLGVVMPDTSTFNNVYNNTLVPRLASIGVKPADVYKLTVGNGSSQDKGQVVAQMNSAITKFETDTPPINHVIFLGGAIEGTAGNMSYFFMAQAEKQHYNPRYGLTSLDAPGVLLGSEAPDDQLVNSVAVGFLPMFDSIDPELAPYPTFAGESKCYSIGKAEGVQQSSRYNNAALLQYCDALLSLQAASRNLQGSRMTQAALAAALQQLGTSVPGAVTAASNWQPNEYDVSSGYRLLKWDDNCNCASSYNVDHNGNTYVYTDKTVRRIPNAE